MKNIIYLFLITLSVTACSIDNFDAPNATLSGKVVDDVTGEAVENGGVNNGTRIQLFENNSPQPVLSYAFPDGHFMNAALFTGDYKVNALGAFKMIKDTLQVSVTKHTELDIKVIPNIRLSASLLGRNGSTATVRVTYEKVHADQRLSQLAVVWSTVNNPNVYNFPNGGQQTVNIGSSTPDSGELTFTLEDLSPGATYYVRAAGLTNAPGGYYNYSKTIKSQ